LEIGCGVGVLSSYLAEKYKWNVAGIDLDPEQIERAKKDYGKNDLLKFLGADATKLPFGDNKYDLVLSIDALHHIPDWDKALNEIDRVLKLNGFYVFSDIALPKIFGKFSLSVDGIINYLRRNYL